ncbi:hypothetical protein SprV_0200651500 [Sparganum proliferum]
MAVEATEEDASKDLPGNVKQLDAYVVVTNLAAVLVFLDVYYGGVPEVLKDFACSPIFRISGASLPISRESPRL